MTQPGENKMSDLIYLFIDGETDGTQQNVLFKSLADNPELQTEFQEAIFLNKAFVSDSRVLTPTNELTNSLFVSAGFQPAINEVPIANEIGGSGKGFWSGFIGKFKSTVLPASVGSIITAALLLTGIYIFDIGKSGSNNAYSQKNQPVIVKEDKAENNVPVIKSESLNEGTVIRKDIFGHSGNLSRRLYNSNSNAVNNIVQTSSTVDNSNVKETTPETENNNSNEISMISLSEPTKPTNIGLSKPEGVSLNTFSMKPDEKSNIFTGGNIGLLLEVKGISGFVYAPSRSIIDDSKVFLKNVGLNLFYKLSSSDYIGIETGNESLQMYRVVADSSGIGFVKEPDLFFLNGAWRHNYHGLELMNNLMPFSEISLGYSKWGPVGKAIAGIYYNPENRFSFGIGLEGTALAYTFQSKTKFTEKLGLVYFFGYHF